MKDVWLEGLERPDDAQREHERPAIAPGKRTLTQRLAVRSSSSPIQRPATSQARTVAPVQRREDRGASSALDDPFGLHLAAQQGVDGPSTTLPYADQIQRSFGPAHDISGIQAHIGGPAAEASAAIGATAYATGNHVAFEAAPDLHTAAHEAAHVIQQRAGVQLYGGVGAEGDAYERHADAVADRVVAGQSAADLLGVGPTSSATPAVQRQAAPGPAAAPGAGVSIRQAGGGATNDYLGEHWQEVRAEVATEFARQVGAWLNARLVWGAGKQELATVAVDQLLPTLFMPGFLERLVVGLDELVTGARAIGGKPRSATAWNPAVGRALGRELGGDIRSATRTMSADYARALAARSTRPPREALRPTTRFEHLAVELLERGKVRLAPARQAKPAAPSADEARDAVLGPARQVGNVASGSELTFEPANPIPIEVDPRDAQRSVLQNARSAGDYEDTDGPGSALAVDTARDRFASLDDQDPTTVDLDARIDAFLLHLATMSRNLQQTAHALFGAVETIGHVGGLPWVSRAEALARVILAVDGTIAGIHARLGNELARVVDGPVRQRLLASAQTEAAARISQAQLVELSEKAIETLRDVEEAAGAIFSINMMILSIAVSFVAAEVGAVIATSLLNALARTSLSGVTLIAAQGSAYIAGQVTEAAINAAFQTAFLGDSTGEAFAENLLASLLTQGASRAVGAVNRAAARGGKAGRVGRVAGQAMEVAAGAGAAVVAQAVVRGDGEAADSDRVLQAVAITFGHWLGRRLAVAKERVAARRSADAVELRRRIEELAQRSEKLKALDAPVERAEMVHVVGEAHDVLVAVEHGDTTVQGDASGPGQAESGASVDGASTADQAVDKPLSRAQRKRLRKAARRQAEGEATPGATLLGIDEALRSAAGRIPPEPGFIDVVVHGEVDNFVIVRVDGEVRIDQRSFATYLRKQGLEGHSIRLIACDSGRHPRGIAQQLANKLHVRVRAPSEPIWVTDTGEMGIGRRPGAHTGRWETFAPKRSSPRAEKFDPLAAERRSRAPADGDTAAVDFDPPTAVVAPRQDLRQRVSPDTLATLSQQLGAPVVIDPTLQNGVSIAVERRAALIGFDLHVTRVRVGVDALSADVLAHASTIANVGYYNGVVGKLRALWHRLRGVAPGGNPYQRGTRAWATHEELARLDQLLAARHLGADGTVDAATLADEIAFLEGRRRYHEESLTGIQEQNPGDAFTIDGPDIGAVTREAEARGYRLPGPNEGVQSDWYYYRNKPGDPGAYALAINPYKAPPDAPSFQAKVVNRQFAGLEPATRVAAVEIPPDMAPGDVVAHLRATEGFGPYAEMLTRHGIASPALIDGVVATMRGRKLTQGDRVTTDTLRGAVKDHFRERVVAKLLDPGLDPRASYRQMREMLDGLAPADRGNLAEAWYAGRHAPDAQTQVGVLIPRSSGENAGQLERRVLDLVDGETAVELKDIEGKIDPEQFAALRDMLEMSVQGSSLGVRRLRYVFTKPEGAIANLETFANAMSEIDLEGRVSVEVFDRDGNMHTVRTRKQALALLQVLRGTR